jgi:hypothetical protein
MGELWLEEFKNIYNIFDLASPDRHGFQEGLEG